MGRLENGEQTIGKGVDAIEAKRQRRPSLAVDGAPFAVAAGCGEIAEERSRVVDVRREDDPPLAVEEDRRSVVPPLRAAPAPFVEAVDVLELGWDDVPAVLGGNAPAAVLLHGEETEVDREEVPVPGREKQVAVEVVEGVPAVLAVGPKDIAPFPFLAPDEFEARLQDERAVGADDAHARLGRGLGAAFLEFARAKVAEG